MGIKLNKDLSYLLGLITGRGHISSPNYRIVIEFAHKNEYLRSIPKCPHCGGVVKTKREDNPDKLDFCDKCKRQIKKAKYNISFNQREEVLKCIDGFLSKLISRLAGKKPDVSGNKYITYISIDLSDKKELFDWIADLFKPYSSFDFFRIPSIIHKQSIEIKKEFMKGIADSAGFPTWSGWIMAANADRARIYLQIVRNWYLPVELCNMLQDGLDVPVQTIDYGHPNIRDPDMIEYIEKEGGTSWGREHQVKIYPEAFKDIGFNFHHKQKIFLELVKHNKSNNFPKPEKHFPPIKIDKGQFKINHAGEKEKRLPPELSGKHFDAFWQICWKLGCSQIKKQMSKFKNPEYCYITGIKDYKNKQQTLKEIDLGDIKKRIGKLRKVKLENARKKWKVIMKLKQKKVKKLRKEKENEEAKLYEPMKDWLDSFLKKKHPKCNVKTDNTSKQYLSKFMAQNDLYDQFEFCEEFDIKPDIVGFVPEESKLAFIEAKIGALTLKDIGQLLGYCQVAKPELALLLSPENPSASLIKILSTHQDLLEYNNKSIIIGRWNTKKNEIDIKSIFPKNKLS